ncbi:MAG: hypothetical protein ACFNTA_00145 [Campylobacter sp.]|uniref:hypothetical protein n=1 Tax=Campylobacter sp. TaxID=205 RepID=UPI003606DD5E
MQAIARGLLPFLLFVKFSFGIGWAVKFDAEAARSWFGLRFMIFVVRKFCASVAKCDKI